MTNLEVKMTIKTLARKGMAQREIARQLELNEATVRYHLRRMAEGSEDGRARQRLAWRPSSTRRSRVGESREARLPTAPPFTSGW